MGKIRPPRSRESASAKTVFTHKPFADEKRTSWSSSSVLATMRHPSEMTGEELGTASVAAAREQIDSERFWDMLAERAAGLSNSMEPRDISLLLNAMSRTRRLSNHLPLIEALENSINKQLPYFSSTQIAMVFSAIAKSFAPAVLPSELLPRLVEEVKSRVHEFGSSVEISMVLNALAKLGVVDSGLSQRLSTIIQSKIRSGSVLFNPRELCVIAHALSQMGVRETLLFEMIESRVLPSMAELTPVETARLLVGFARAGKNLDRLLEAATVICSLRFRSMSSAELVNAVYSFCSLCEYLPSSSQQIELVDDLKHACIQSLALFQPREIAAILTSFSRWHIQLRPEEVETLANRLRLMSKRIDGVDLVGIVGSIWSISSRDSRNVGCLTDLLSQWLLQVEATIPHSTDWQIIAKAVEAYCQIGLGKELVNCLSICVVNNGAASIDHSARIALSQSLETVLDTDSDLLQVLRSP